MSKDQLQLKDIAPYLPYALKAMYGNPPNLEYKEVTIVGMDYREHETHPARISADWMDSEHIWMFKPLLHPLSSLTKPITVPHYNNGEPFVPMDELNKKLSSSYFKFQTDKVLPFLLLNVNRDLAINMTSVPMKCLNLLHQWHFDVSGLIEKGLAKAIEQ